MLYNKDASIISVPLVGVHVSNMTMILKTHLRPLLDF